MPVDDNQLLTPLIVELARCEINKLSLAEGLMFSFAAWSCVEIAGLWQSFVMSRIWQ